MKHYNNVPRCSSISKIVDNKGTQRVVSTSDLRTLVDSFKSTTLSVLILVVFAFAFSMASLPMFAINSGDT